MLFPYLQCPQLVLQRSFLLCEIKGTCGEDTQLYRYENNLTFSAILTLEIPSNEPQSFSSSFPKPVV